ncbi:riboflavin synthase [Temperatibacter marinus]|uniref:Riboflavin synthase n=1 Tax=Temperatibacter marinus TaxID=1456591 RepID=A0AA52EHM6_9PROT|nr:riboflavin synthase [Temperatibacter marinus]WND02231.1 riboflavin synthase [Temperatibacter marinus]
MFTGIITDVGQVRKLDRKDQANSDLRIEFSTSYEMNTVEIGASIASSGVCLTVVDKGIDKTTNWYAVDVSDETLRVTNLSEWTVGSEVNLERALKVGDELGGHIVTGHVDCIGTIVTFKETAGSITMEIEIPRSEGNQVAEKGSVCIDGASLTVNTIKDTNTTTSFSINLIPHTQSVTSFRNSKVGDKVNIEFDVLARYVARLQA